MRKLSKYNETSIPMQVKATTKVLAGIFMLLLLLAANYGYAQGINADEDDPYKKPAIWKKLRANPNDSTLWTVYVGKKWNMMNRTERENIARWRQELYIQSIADKESIIGELDEAKAASDALFAEAPRPQPAAATRFVSEADMKQLANLEALIMKEPETITELKKNIFENFVILEDAFNEAFSELGARYRYYDEVHPDRKYSELRWIEEQETRLKQLKIAKVNALRKQFTGR